MVVVHAGEEAAALQKRPDATQLSVDRFPALGQGPLVDVAHHDDVVPDFPRTFTPSMLLATSKG